MVKEKTAIIAHRGNSGEAPENTVIAVKQAIHLGADFVEIDVRLSLDLIPVVIHDDTLLRMTKKRHLLPVHLLSYDTLKQTAIKSKFAELYDGEKIPRLLELLQLKWGNTGLMIEIKEVPQSAETIVDIVIKEIRSIHESLLPRLVIGSFSLDIYDALSRRLHDFPDGTTLIGIVEKAKYLKEYIARGAKRIAVWCKIIDKDVVDFLNQNQVEIWSFTIDDPALAGHLTQLGVAGIITNNPLKFIKLDHN